MKYKYLGGYSAKGNTILLSKFFDKTDRIDNSQTRRRINAYILCPPYVLRPLTIWYRDFVIKILQFRNSLMS